MALKSNWLAIAGCVWLFAELIASWDALRDSWTGFDRAGKRLWLARLLVAALWIRGLLLIVESMSADSALPLLLEALAWFGAGAAALILLNALHRSQAQGRGRLAPSSESVARLSSSPTFSIRKDGKSLLYWRAVWLILAVSASVTVWENTSGNQIQPYHHGHLVCQRAVLVAVICATWMECLQLGKRSYRRRALLFRA